MKICRRGIHKYEGSRCPACRKLSRVEHSKEYSAAWRKANRASALVYSRQYYIANREQLKADARAKYATTKINSKEYYKEYRASHRAERAALNAKRRAAKLQRTPKWLTPAQHEEIKEFYLLAKELQWLSAQSDKLSVDHIVPLQGKNVSGLHVPWNLQILPKSLNSQKYNNL